MNGRLDGRRVVIVVAWAILGGAERSVLTLARHLREREGAEVDVLAFTAEGGRFREAVEELGIPWHPYPLTWHGGRRSKVRSLAGLTSRLRHLHPDVVAPYTSRPNVLCGLVWRATGASLCVWNQQDLARPEKFSDSTVTRAARMTPLLVANSRAAKDHLIAYFGAPADRVRVIREAAQRFAPTDDGTTWRMRLGINDRTLVVSMLAHLHMGKDHETLLRAWPSVVGRMDATGQKPVLLVAGRPAGSEDALKALAFDLGLSRSVRFLGDVLDVGGLLDATDIAVLSSRSESAPHALLESMSMGLPVAATDVPGIREIFEEPQRAFLASPGDPAGLADAIVGLAADPGLRRELGELNARHVLRLAPRPAAETTATTIVGALERRSRSGRRPRRTTAVRPSRTPFRLQRR